MVQILLIVSHLKRITAMLEREAKKGLHIAFI